MAGIRKTGINIVVSTITSILLVMFLVLIWESLSGLIVGMSVGPFMFFTTAFWQFVALITGFLFIVKLFVNSWANAKLGGKAQ